jgi:hypothetical protein
MVVWYSLLSFGIFFRFGTFGPKKSGNPALPAYLGPVRLGEPEEELADQAEGVKVKVEQDRLQVVQLLHQLVDVRPHELGANILILKIIHEQIGDKNWRC